jgi:hypothetical protein
VRENDEVPHTHGPFQIPKGVPISTPHVPYFYPRQVSKPNTANSPTYATAHQKLYVSLNFFNCTMSLLETDICQLVEQNWRLQSSWPSLLPLPRLLLLHTLFLLSLLYLMPLPMTLILLSRR